jgi:predicted outer membrane repeat protein
MAQNGGALAIITPTFIKENYDNEKHLGIKLINTRFEGNQANNLGGALYLENPSKAVIDGCTFRGNNASSLSIKKYLKGYKAPIIDEYSIDLQSHFETGIGGGIYYVCDPSSATGSLDCEVEISSSVFQSN